MMRVVKDMVGDPHSGVAFASFGALPGISSLSFRPSEAS